jgi:hypothetical protein
MGYRCLNGMIQSSFFNLKSHHFFVLCFACFSSFYASLCVYKGVGCA